MARTLCMVPIIWAATLCLAHAATILDLQAKGVQIYRCAPKPPGMAWTLQAPDAQLEDSSGKPAGHHFAGPSWQAPDGSTILGKPVGAGTAPVAHAIPWLVVQIASHTGSGVFSDIAYVVRSHTAGGLPPATGCDAAHAGAGIRIPYTATYTFYPAK